MTQKALLQLSYTPAMANIENANLFSFSSLNLLTTQFPWFRFSLLQTERISLESTMLQYTRASLTIRKWLSLFTALVQVSTTKPTLVILNKNQTYFKVANDTYQGLTTCDSLRDSNPYGEFDLHPGFELKIHLWCACPPRDQTLKQTKYLLTYSVSWR